MFDEEDQPTGDDRHPLADDHDEYEDDDDDAPNDNDEEVIPVAHAADDACEDDSTGDHCAGMFASYPLPV